MADWTIRRLDKKHNRSHFDCGLSQLNEWLTDRAGQFDRRDLSRTYVATRIEESNVLGYYSISSHRVGHEDLMPEQSKGLPAIDVPVVLLGRLAVCKSVQGHGLGAVLLVDALRRASQISEQVGIRAVEVDAINEQARQFYIKFGFRSLRDDPKHLYMPIHEIRMLKFPSIK